MGDAMRFGTGVICGVLVSVLCGCSSVTGAGIAEAGKNPYPETWSRLEEAATSDGCPKLEGTYATHGDGIFPTGPREADNLSFVFYALGHSPQVGGGIPGWRIPPDAVTVSIKQSPGLFTLTFVTQTGDAKTLEFKRYRLLSAASFTGKVGNLFNCYQAKAGNRLGFLVETGSHSEGDLLHAGGGGTQVFLLKGSDGSLILQRRTSSLGVSPLIVGTHASMESAWMRYPPYRN